MAATGAMLGAMHEPETTAVEGPPDVAWGAFTSDAPWILPDGPLAWQRKLRYHNRCDLYLYTEPQIRALADASGAKSSSIEMISRDYFVTLAV